MRLWHLTFSYFFIIDNLLKIIIVTVFLKIFNNVTGL